MGSARSARESDPYDTATPDGAVIWAHAQTAMAPTVAPLAGDAPPTKRYGPPQLVRPRLGQRGFQFRMYEAYDRRCAMTGESTLPTLDAAHIVPYSEPNSSHEVNNGLLLRTDFHRLFDAGLVTVEPDLTIRVSPQIRDAYFNGKAYYRLDGAPIRQPTRPEWRPDPDLLRWHNEHRFVR